MKKPRLRLPKQPGELVVGQVKNPDSKTRTPTLLSTCIDWFRAKGKSILRALSLGLKWPQEGALGVALFLREGAFESVSIFLASQACSP